MHPRPRIAWLLAGLVLLLAGPVLVDGRATAADTSPAPAGSAVWPLSPAPTVVAGFDPPASRWGAGHRGVDLAGAPGQAVRAALVGTVTFAGTLAGRGVVVVDHGATRTTYEPVDPTVRVGDLVGAGDRIGRLQRGGSHCAPATCLHWGLLEGDRYLDPLTLVGAGPVRLLPLGGVPDGRVDVGSPGVTGGGLPAWARTASRSVQLPSPHGDAAMFRGS